MHSYLSLAAKLGFGLNRVLWYIVDWTFLNIIQPGVKLSPLSFFVGSKCKMTAIKTSF